MWPERLTSSKKLFIIDCERKGNVVRFYLGDDPDYHGDDWNDYSYENTCSLVYYEYIKGYKDISFPFDYLVMEPSNGCHLESGFCRNDFKNGLVPCIVVVPIDLEIAKHAYPSEDYYRWGNHKKVQRYYFGDEMVPDVWLDKEEKEA